MKQQTGGDKALTMAKDSRLRNGSNTSDRGCTHGSVSAKIIPVDAISGKLLTSIIRSDVADCDNVVMGAPTGANADAAPSKKVAINNTLIRLIFKESTDDAFTEE